MRLTQLRAAGLSDEEAKVYSLLLEGGPQTAGFMLKDAGVKRGTLYQVLRSLEAKRLVSESRSGSKILFSPEAPDTLLDRAKDRKEEAARMEAEIAAALPELKTAYLSASQKPIFRFYEGIEGLKAIYDRQLEGTKEIWFLRASEAGAYEKHFGKWWAHFIRRRVERGIVTYGLTPDAADANHDPAIDKAWGLARTWVRPEDYDAPIEIDVFGDCVAIISFGKTVFGIVMENAPLAEAFRQVFRLMRFGAEQRPPKHGHG